MSALAALLAETAPWGEDPRREQWTSFVQLLSPRLREAAAGMCLRPGTVEAMIQDVVVDLLERWEEMRALGAEAVLGLLHKMMHDLAVDEVRRLDRHRTNSLDVGTEPIDHRLSESAEGVERSEWSEWVATRLAELEREDPENGRFLREYYLRERPMEDLAAEAGCSPHAMECRISRALGRLRRLAAEHPAGGEPPP